jgi:hypothetical protein
MSEKIYVCSVCEKQATVKDGDPVPLCCGRKMEPPPYCTSAPNPEMARNYEGGEPCDDGTGAGGRKKR